MSVTAVNQTASKDAIANVEVIKSATKKVIKKDYILNELDAMKKKLNFQYRDPAISIEGEAKNGATINQGGIFTGIWGYNLPRNIGGSHEMV